MRLKTLEIKGFKSFASQTVINFGEDVIGIVGPNGSGKSNIVDAIRWVLGEQKSRELRLDTMTSVIFNGTKKKKAGGVASVSLTFENTKNLLPTEYSEVTITRMLYRSGDSEYRLNNVPCRLKDITSLFLDTGIGSNSYAIIALGMVDDILADKDNSRRKMFEQAAGISKYKKRKRETLNKLKNTTEDLERVEDLLFEINNNLKSLEKQAKRTKKYFDLKEQYKQLSIDLAIMKVAIFKERKEEITSKLTSEEDKHRQLEIDLRQLEAKLEKEKKDNLDKEKAMSDRQRELNSLVGQIRGMENDKKILEQKINFVQQNESKLKEQIAQNKIKIQQLDEDVYYYRTELNGEKRLEADYEDQLVEAEEALAAIRVSHGELKADLDSVMQEQQQIEREVFELEKKKAINGSRIDNLQKDLERNKDEILERSKEVVLIETRIKNVNEQINDKKILLEKLEKEEQQRIEAIESLRLEMEALQKQIQSVKREIDSKRNEYKLTKSMVENLEGFPESIKFLSKNKEFSESASLLSDLIFVKEGYRIAIENYLDQYLNYYVVKDLAEASQAIQLLSKSQKGKANFFLLDAFADYQPPMTLLPGAQLAIEVVETDEAYRKLVNFLLANVLVTESEEVAKEFSDETQVLLAKSGKFIQKKFSISGGSVGLFEGKKIGRKKNLENLEKAIKKGEANENKLSTSYYKLKDQVEELKQQRYTPQINQEKQALNQLEREKVSHSTKLENFQTFIKQVDERKQGFQVQIDALKNEIKGFDTVLSDQTALVNAAKERISNTDGSFRDAAEKLSAASTAYNEKNIAFIRQQNKVTSLQRELSFREKQLEETRNSLTAAQQTIASATNDIQTIEDDIVKLEQTLLASYDEKKSRATTLNEAEQNYYQARGFINELEENIRRSSKAAQDAQILINSLKDKFTQVKFDISSIAQRLRIEFELDINTIINSEREIDTKLNEEELQLKVGKLKNRLDNYGEINPMAVEAYDEMNERATTITTQRDDILKAKEDLMTTIKEIEETATTQFVEAFEKARVYFIDVFRSLFTEDDNCDLILLNPENPLESKIEIVAKPKGKRPQTISQLSGGEKTLTATALLFALYLLKPAPFCIFDEVDAPLDDANIEKFNKIIKKFSKDSQFIIVTHNKMTMAAVDIIYGVFMPEQGVSAVSPVDFRNFENVSAFEVVGAN